MFRPTATVQALVLALAVPTALLPALGAGFVFDDGLLLTHNPLVLEAGGLRDIWFSTRPFDYVPLTNTSLWLEWRLWGPNPAGYHATNVALHLANALLVWLVLARLGVPGAWLAGLLFGIHPLNASSAAWISERKNTLSALFYLAALAAFLRFERDGRRSGYLLSLASFALACLSKGSVVMLPVVLLGLAWWRRGKILRTDAVRAAPFFALSALIGVATVWFQHNRAMAEELSQPEGALTRLAAAGWAAWFYLGKTLLPFGLTLIYPRWRIDPATVQAWLPLLGLVAGATVLWLGRERWGRPLLAAWGYHLLTLFPVLGLVEMIWLKASRVADHFQYLAVIGPIALAGGAFVRAVERLSPATRRAAQVGAACVVALLGSLSWARAATFADEETLWSQAVKRNPGAWTAQYNLGVALVDRGRKGEAAARFAEAVRLNPGYSAPHNNLGALAAEQGRLDVAVAEFETAARLEPGNLRAQKNLALNLARAGRTEAAITKYRELIERAGADAEARYGLGAALANAGRLDEAILQLLEATSLNRDDPLAHRSLATLLAARGRPAEARAHWLEALRLEPGNPEAKAGLAAAVRALEAPVEGR